MITWLPHHFGLVLKHINVVFCQLSTDDSGRGSEDTGKAMQDFVKQLVCGLYTSVALDVLNSVDVSISSSQTLSCPALSSVNVVMYSSFGKVVMPIIFVVPGQVELPVKLQFGLFPGPSLIPSLDPAMQIGMIKPIRG